MNYFQMDKISFFWFRRDLRLHDNKGLFEALKAGHKIVPLFIFDSEILDKLPINDARVTFIHETLEQMNQELKLHGASLLIKKGNPLVVLQELIDEFEIHAVYANKDYEPYAIQRDQQIHQFLDANKIDFCTCKDQVIFEKSEIVKKDGKPYTVFTPYKNKWLQHFQNERDLQDFEIAFDHFEKCSFQFPTLDKIGFKKSSIRVKPYDFSALGEYDLVRDYPSKDKTSYLSPYLRFGLVSVRRMVSYALDTNEIFLSELIWREFFMQIIFHFPEVVVHNFKRKYDAVVWRNNEEEFEKWCKGETGYPFVDAGMRELNETGYMHNRVRMIVAGFLCKHLLIDWRWGEAYFAEKLLDFDLSANNGNWQWAAGTGCDSAPYFRIFNPIEQVKKFDKELKYINKWVKDFNEITYPMPMVDHKFARERALTTYKKGLQ